MYIGFVITYICTYVRLSMKICKKFPFPHIPQKIDSIAMLPITLSQNLSFKKTHIYIITFFVFSIFGTFIF